MDAEKFERMTEILLAVCDLPDEEQKAYLDEACCDDPELRQEIESILSHREESSRYFESLKNRSETPFGRIDELLRKFGTVGGEKPPPGGESPPGPSGPGSKEREQIGDYRLLETIGEGGMGTVFLAEQVAPVRRRVALKIIKLGMDTKQVVARFEAERQALAVMSHPNIARMYDAGSTDAGRPFFVMELVRGIPVTDYCDRHKLSTRERLELFLPVCDAVQHAHQKGVIHRDLKPSNVLVAIQDGRPVPKIIDFGIAKAIEHRLTEQTIFTEHGQLIGTVDYMSPEQAEMTGLDIDTRTDIYSLGVMLYELLVGALPFDPDTFRSATFAEIQQIIRETEPPKASTRLSSLGEPKSRVAERRRTDPVSLQSQLRGDLDWITMKAMAKDRTGRYSSASELAADIGRHLRSEPILASPPSTAYRFRKFVRRHRTGVTAAALVVLALLVAIAGSSIGLYRARRAEEKARQEAETAKAVSEFLVRLFSVADPDENRGNTITAREILDEGAERIEDELSDQPEIQARLMETMGRVYMSMGLYDRARPMLEKGLGRQRSLHGEDHLDVAKSLRLLGVLSDIQGRYAEAETLFTRSIAVQEKLLGPGHYDLAKNLNSLAVVYGNEGRYDEQEPLLKKSLAIIEEEKGPDHPDVVNTISNLAALYYNLGRYEEAEPLFRRAVDIVEKTYGPDHPDLGATLNNLGSLYETMGKYAEAESLFQRSLAVWEHALGEDHPDVGIVLNNLANLNRDMGRPAEAESLYHRSTVIWKHGLGEEHPFVAVNLVELANLYRDAQRYAEAESLYLQAIDIQEKALGTGHPQLRETLENYAELLRRMGNDSEAERIESRLSALGEGG